jgi:CIC family chloride channel protein
VLRVKRHLSSQLDLIARLLGGALRRGTRQLGLREEASLLLPAVVVGVVAAAAAVGFHELIVYLRDFLYERPGPGVLYSWPGLLLLILFPAVGGLLVGVISRVMRGREGHGVVDVMESVIRSAGFERPLTAVEKILTSALTIGSGGSAGAEGPIVQIGAAISAAAGRVFGVARHHMPILVGCGTAAGISAIFNAPIGGVLFTLEVILLDFSLRSFTPVVVAAVIANVTTRTIFDLLAAGHGGEGYHAIFGVAANDVSGGINVLLDWPQLGNYLLLGVVCGVLGAVLIRGMRLAEVAFDRVRKLGVFRPAIGGALTGVLGVIFVLLGGWWFGVDKPVPFAVYPMPAFFGDGYGATRHLLEPAFFEGGGAAIVLLLALLVFKILATCLTLGSGGSGGVIAPSLLIGATAGGTVGTLLSRAGIFDGLRPELYALVGMGAVLAAVVHAPLASILILFEVTTEYRVVLPAMLACITAVGTAKLLYRDSVYTAGLRRRGVRRAAGQDLDTLRRLRVEQVNLEPASVVQAGDSLDQVAKLMSRLETGHFAVLSPDGTYAGMLLSDDLNAALLAPEALPLMTASELMRTDIPPLRHTDDLATCFEAFVRLEVSRLPVVLAHQPDKVIGLLSRAGLMDRYRRETE